MGSLLEPRGQVGRRTGLKSRTGAISTRLTALTRTLGHSASVMREFQRSVKSPSSFQSPAEV
jgi:hypothetical protein